MNSVFIYIAVAVCWLYVIYYLINGRKIKVMCENGTKKYYYIIFGLLALAVLPRNEGLKGLICAALIFLSGVLYSSIPSGYNEAGIFLNGRFYPFHKIRDMKINVAGDKMMLEFKCGRGTRMLFSSIEEKRKLDQCLNIYLNVMKYGSKKR